MAERQEIKRGLQDRNKGQDRSKGEVGKTKGVNGKTIRGEE